MFSGKKAEQEKGVDTPRHEKLDYLARAKAADEAFYASRAGMSDGRLEGREERIALSALDGYMGDGRKLARCKTHNIVHCKAVGCPDCAMGVGKVIEVLKDYDLRAVPTKVRLFSDQWVEKAELDKMKKYEGVKADAGKPRMSLIDSSWLLGVADILAFGERKYASHNWRGGFKYSRLMDACQRHLAAFIDGEDKDPESGKSHLLHASCCLMFLFWMTVKRPDQDDRYKAES